MKPYIKLLAATVIASSLAACDGDQALPPMVLPQATIQANTSIADLKAMYWQSAEDYNSEIAALADGSHVIIAGRVISSDESGSVHKNIYVQDSTAAITIAVNGYDLYQSYQYGQEIVIDCTELYAGRYSGLMQLGSPNGSGITFMDKTVFADHTQLNGLGQPSMVKPLSRTIEQLNSYSSNTDSLMLYQSQLVKIDGVSFVDTGFRFAPSANTDRYIKDANGNRINVRCSNYSSFKDSVIPDGTGSITALLSYFKGWQLVLMDLDDLEGFTPAEPIYIPEGEQTYKKATTLESGKMYAMVAGNMLAQPLSGNYGYLQQQEVSIEADGTFKADAKNAFTFTAVDGGYTIYSGGKYYGMEGTFNSFNTYTEASGNGSIWTITAQTDGTMAITNVEMGKSIQYSSQYSSFGAYSDKRGDYPVLYEIVK